MRLASVGVIMLLLVPAAARGQETKTYTYDGLGRLVGSTTVGVPSEARINAFDAASNRTREAIGVAPPPPPPPPPPPSNQPPVAVLDALTVSACTTGTTKNLVANDTDPDNNYPLSLHQVGTTSIAVITPINSTTVQVDAGDVASNQTRDIAYVVRDNLGAQSTGIFRLTVIDAVCSLPQPSN